MIDDYQELQAFLERNGFTEVCVIGEKVCGLCDFFSTRGIVVGLTMDGMERRYCYQTRDEANAAFELYRRNDDDDAHPTGNWIKHKGQYRGQHVDDLNPNWSKAQ